MSDGPEGSVAAELVARIQRGDGSAERALVERYGPGLRMLLRRLARDPDLAADLEQETFRLVLEKVRRGEIRSPDKLAAFMRATARNLFIMDRRKASRYVELEDRAVVEPAPAPSGDALDKAIRQQQATLVRRLLGDLRNERDRQLLIRYYLSEDPRETICHDLGIDPGRLNRVLFRARRRLRALFDLSPERLLGGGDPAALPVPGRSPAGLAPTSSTTAGSATAGSGTGGIDRPTSWGETGSEVGVSRRA